MVVNHLFLIFLKIYGIIYIQNEKGIDNYDV